MPFDPMCPNLPHSTPCQTPQAFNPARPPPPSNSTNAGVAPAGECTADPQAGILAWYEIKTRGITPKVDPYGMGAYASFGPNNENWVGFDTKETLRSKVRASTFGAACLVILARGERKARRAGRGGGGLSTFTVHVPVLIVL